MRKKEDQLLPKYDTNKTIRKEIDKRLKSIASINAHLGTDSTKKEILKAEQQIKKIAFDIKQIDNVFFGLTFPEYVTK